MSKDRKKDDPEDLVYKKRLPIARDLLALVRSLRDSTPAQGGARIVRGKATEGGWPRLTKAQLAPLATKNKASIKTVERVFSDLKARGASMTATRAQVVLGATLLEELEEETRAGMRDLGREARLRLPKK